jgi:hypothetical protein
MADLTIGVVGLGSIGRRVAELCLTFGSRVIATRRQPSISDGLQGRIEILPSQELPELMSRSDFIVLALPLTSGVGPPMTYMFEGKQYIAVFAGSGPAAGRGGQGKGKGAPPPAGEATAAAAQANNVVPVPPPAAANTNPRLLVYAVPN